VEMRKKRNKKKISPKGILEGEGYSMMKLGLRI
jgi:hypothetical protein